MGKYRFWCSTFVSILIIVSQGQQQQPPYRTQGGYIRADSILSLQATATQSGKTLATTDIHNVKVGQFAQILIEQESGNMLIVKDTGWMSFLLTNKGNGEDSFDNFVTRYEGPSGAARWLIELYEQRIPNAFYEQATRMLNSRTLQFDADETRRYFVRLRPPSDRQTDGLEAAFDCRSVFANTVRSEWTYLVGAESSTSFTSRMGVPLGNQIAIPPIVIQDRLFWMVNNPSLNKVLMYTTPNPLTVSTPFQGNTAQIGAMNGMLLDRQGAQAGNFWYMLRNNGSLIRIDLNTTTSVNWSPVTLPPEITIRNDLPFLGDNQHLYFLDNNGILNMLRVADHTLVRTPLLGAMFTTSFSLSGNHIVITLQSGIVFLFNRSNLSLRTISLPLPNSRIDYAPAYDHFRGNIAIVSGSKLQVLNDRTYNWFWSFDAEQPIIGSPVYVPDSDAFFFVTADRKIWAVNASTAQVLFPYPQPLFDVGTIESAMLTYVTPKEKKVPYVYLSAMVNEGDGVIRPRLAMVTAWNPLNRLYDNSIPPDSVPHAPILTSVPSVNGLLMLWFPQIVSTDRGWVYGFQVR